MTAPAEKSVVQTDFVGVFDGIDDWMSHTEGGIVGIRTRVVEEREKEEKRGRNKEMRDGQHSCWAIFPPALLQCLAPAAV